MVHARAHADSRRCRLSAKDLPISESAFLATIAVAKGLAHRSRCDGQVPRTHAALNTIALVAALLYVISHWSGSDQAQGWKFDCVAAEAYTWAASFLLALLAWYDCGPWA